MKKSKMPSLAPIFFLLFIFHISLLPLLSQPVTQEWARRYDNPEHTGDGAVAIGLDYAGNIYVTGSYTSTTQNNNFVTIKYNPQGDTQWVKTYNGPGNDRDVPSAMFVDSVGNVYVTGYSVGAGTGEDYITLKYNTNGALLWGARYNGPANGNDDGSGITVNKVGYVYVTGGSSGDVVTIKYTPNGDTVWVKRFHEYQRSDAGGWVKLDSLGNVYVLAQCWYSYPPIASYLTIKYSTNGDSLWSVKYYNTVFSENYPTGMDVDRFGSVYITGYSSGNNTNYDYATIRYNTNGIQQWVERYDGPSHGTDVPHCIVLDNNGNVYITGESYQTGFENDYLSIKYNTNGDSLWVKRYNGTGNSYDYAYGITLDDSANVYVTGSSTGTAGGDITTVRYTSNGNQEWVMRYIGGGKSLKVDRNRKVYVLGYNTVAGTGTDIITLKYAQFVGIHQITNEIPSYYRLFQNYPNPFNIKSKIKYQISKIVDVKLEIFDVLGQEITTLVNKKLNPGIYEAEWDGENYPSGIYFYRIITNDYTETKKMVLNK